MLTEREREDVKEMKAMDGWQHVLRSVTENINMAEKALLYWEWEHDNNGQVSTKSVNEYERKQMELRLLEAFVAFLQNDDIIEEEDREIFDNTSK